MKANGAPEKLYIDFRDRAESTWRCAYTEKALANDIEYVRKDVFIEKACEWLKEQDEMVGISFTEDFIARFQNYMKGE